ncbi:MAG: polysaccharide biosynthesis/export family protein [Candidatus Sericytochromatia bacterium]
MQRLFTTLLLASALLGVQLGLQAPAWALYQLAYGDTISITVKDAPQYSVAAPIRPDGAVTVPYLGDLEVVGLTPAQLGERIEKLVARFVRNPQVSVTVTGFRGRQITILGQVARVGNVTVPPAAVSPTIVDAIAAAGGFTDRANRSEVLLVRGDGANAQRIVIDVDRMIRSGDFSQNIAVEERDKIVVPEVWYPDYRPGIAAVATVASVLGSLAVIVALYNRASGQ